MEEIQKALQLLGHNVEDKITGLKGVIVSISFDVSGCIQGLLKPPAITEGKIPDGYWFDTKRLRQLSEVPIVDQPSFSVIPGGEELPGFREMPSKN